MTATEVARAFSSVLNRVQAGEEIEIVRNGAPVAVIKSPPVKKRWVSAAELQAVVDTLEPFDDDFVKDVEEARRLAGLAEFKDPWEES
jgi:prevent-host-death family protein